MTLVGPTTLALLSFVLWQTALFTLLCCLWIVIRSAWGMAGIKVRLAVAILACLGAAMSGRASWTLRGIWRLRATPETVAAAPSLPEFFIWSAATFLLSVAMLLELRRLFRILEERLLELEP